MHQGEFYDQFADSDEPRFKNTWAGRWDRSSCPSSGGKGKDKDRPWIGFVPLKLEEDPSPGRIRTEFNFESMARSKVDQDEKRAKRQGASTHQATCRRSEMC